jgi:hypothetical protein
VSSQIRGCLLRHVLQRTNTDEADVLPCCTYCTAPEASSRPSLVTHVDFELVKLRLPGRRGTADQTTAPGTDADTDLSEQLARAAGKGRPTPKRTEAQGRRQGPPPPPPTTRKEAYKRMREQQAVKRVETRAGMARGDDSSLPNRDRGPVRRYVRDVVDSRRNVGSFFLVIAAVALIGTIAPSPLVKNYATLLLFGFFLVMIVDSVVLSRRIKRKVAARFPDAKDKSRGLAWYGISRSTMIRRWRFPKPEVALGADV